MTNDALPDYVRALLEPASYPHTPASVELVQTHISYVFLADDNPANLSAQYFKSIGKAFGFRRA